MMLSLIVIIVIVMNKVKYLSIVYSHLIGILQIIDRDYKSTLLHYFVLGFISLVLMLEMAKHRSRVRQKIS